LIDTLDTTIPPVVKYFKRNVYISYPSSSIVLVYDVAKGFWQPPWIMGIRAFSIYNGDLYGHSSRVAETYKMLDGYNDNGSAYECIAAFSYRNYGKRGVQKEFDEYYVEGYIASNTTLNLDQEFEYQGFESVVSKQITGTDTEYLFSSTTDSSLGENPLGEEPLGDSAGTVDDLSKFRTIFTGRSIDFYEYRQVYSSNQADARWEILAEGPNTRYSKADSIHIKQ